MRRFQALLLLGALLAGSTVCLAGFRNARYQVKRSAAKNTRTAAIVTVLEFEVNSEDVFPARAVDPVLYIGDIEVREYRYTDTENKTLIFTCFEADKLKDNAPVYLQYENDEATRTDLPPFRRDEVGKGWRR